MSDLFCFLDGFGGGGPLNKSILIVSVPAGSMVTATLGPQIKTAQEKNGEAWLRNLDVGEWNLKLTLGEQSATAKYNIERFGVYDASLRIVADWEWFLKVAAFHDDVSLEYLNVDVAQFNIDGISNRSPQLCIEERQLVLDRYMSRRMQADYLLLTKYRNVRYCNQSRLIEYIIRLIAKFAKYKYGV